MAAQPVPALAERFHVIAPDTRGCGRSERTPWGHRTARYAADHIPGARLEIFDDSNHALFYSEAERFNRKVADFVLDLLHTPD